MSSWADESEDPPASPRGGEGSGAGAYGGGGGGGPPKERPRLQLKPRSAQGVSAAQQAASASAKSNPFGAAKPREQVLAEKGVDPKLVDSRIEKKAEVSHLTKEQEEEVEAVRKELTEAEIKLREANEMELPEETYRVKYDEKKKELNGIVEKFSKMNLEKKKSRGSAGEGGDSGATGQRLHYERPSERRKRLDEERGGGSDGGSYRRGGGGGYYDNDNEEDGGDDAFKSFGGRTRRSGRGDGGGGGRGGSYSGSTGNPHWD